MAGRIWTEDTETWLTIGVSLKDGLLLLPSVFAQWTGGKGKT